MENLQCGLNTAVIFYMLKIKIIILALDPNLEPKEYIQFYCWIQFNGMPALCSSDINSVFNGHPFVASYHPQQKKNLVEFT